jgi:FkbM family methyltransferase
LQAARLVGTSGEVHSFEPTPETLSILKQNIQVNGLAEEGIVHVYPEAVSDRNGPATLAVFGNNSGHNTIFGDGAESFSIPVLTVALDEKLPDRRIDLVKIDAEGAEPSIIAGMRKTIARNPGMPIILEFAPAHLRRAGWEPLAFLQDLRRLGLNISLIDDLTGDLRGFEDETLAGVFSANLWLQCSRPCESGS